MNNILILIFAVTLDFILGDPINIPHPIIYIGKVISKYEEIIRKSKINLKLGGFLLLICSITTVTFIISIILYICSIIHPVLNVLITIYFIYTSLATKCLKDEALKVYKSLKANDIEKSRKLLSYLVGRDTSNLSNIDIIRALVETVSENTIDGVLAPMFYIGIGFILGIPVQLVFMYKTINTLDSMVGYKNEKYKNIGFASAKLDDIVNFIPARIGSIIILISGLILRYDFFNGIKIFLRDRLNHKSPNSGHPESVVAGLLNIELGGTNIYFGEKVYKPTIGDHKETLNINHIIKTTKILYLSQIISAFIIVITIYIGR